MARKGEKSALKRAKETLNRRGALSFAKKRRELHEHDIDVKENWNAGNNVKIIPTRSKMSFGTKLFITSIIFFVIAVGISLLIFFNGANIVSSKNVDINITGPVSVESGKEFSFQILIENRNNIALEFADLLIEYPEGTRVAGNIEQELSRTREFLETIKAGEIIKEIKRATLFGQEGSKKELNITLEYRVKGSNAIFVAEKKYNIHISSSPISLLITNLSETISGQEFELEIKLTSNSNDIVKDLLISIDYPFGFSFVSAIPEPSFGNNIWTIGDVEARGVRTIRMRGIIEGQDKDEKVFKINSGVVDSGDNRKIGVLYGSSVESIHITRPFLGLQLFVNGKLLDEYTARAGINNQVEIAWINNTPTKIIDIQIEAKLSGDILDKQSVKVKGGFYRSIDNTIIWNEGTFDEFKSIQPGESGSVTFGFSPLSLADQIGKIFKRPTISINVSASGNRLSQEGVPEDIKSSTSRIIKINSDIAFSQRAVYHVGPFTNSGPIPPQAEKETTYTIFWTVINSSNDLRNSVATAKLPTYVRWIGRSIPTSERINFNDVEREIRWELGDIEDGVGITLPPREIAFQIGLLPSVSHIDIRPLLIGDGEFSGKDTFTGDILSSNNRSLNTNLSSDPQFKISDEKVIP